MPGNDDVVPFPDGVANAFDVDDIPDVAPALAQVYAYPGLFCTRRHGPSIALRDKILKSIRVSASHRFLGKIKSKWL
jgi:hypothetical protein